MSPRRVPAPADRLDATAVAELLRVDLNTVSRWSEARKLTAIDGPGGIRSYARDEVMRLVVDAKRTRRSAATQGPRSLAAGSVERDRGVILAEAALDVTLMDQDTASAATRVSTAAHHAARDRATVGRAAAEALAASAAQDVVAARFRADAVATRVHAAAVLAADQERSAARPDDPAALERAARTLATVEAAAAAVVVETVALAEAVARTVAMAAELVAAAEATLERAVAAEVAAAAAGMELRAVAAALVNAEDVAIRLQRTGP